MTKKSVGVAALAVVSLALLAGCAGTSGGAPADRDLTIVVAA